MGFKSKEVSMGAHKSSQGAHSRQPPLNCPRCNSSNTKFCYYNNHNESQPRYYCKSCKRHWTQGGTLRDVPVGGTRRNKRLKTSTSGSSSGTGDCVQQQQYQLTLDTNTFMLDSTPLLPSFFFNNLTPFDGLNSTFSFTNLNQFQLPNSDEIVQEENPSNTTTNKATTEAIKSSWELPSTSSLIPFDASISPFLFTSPVQFQPSNSDEITQEEHPCNSSSTTTNNTASEVINPSLELPSTSTVMDSLRDWSWDDLNMLISTTTTATDINQPLDGLQIEEHEV